MPFFSSIVVMVPVVIVAQCRRGVRMVIGRCPSALRALQADAARRAGADRRRTASQQHHPGLADDLAGQEVERAEGKPQEHDRIHDQADHARGHTASTSRRRAAAYRPRGRRIPTAGTRPPRRSPAPAAPAAPRAPRRPGSRRRRSQTPSRRCTRSRSTSAMPTISTPDGAIRPARPEPGRAVRHAHRADIADHPVGRRNGEAEQHEEDHAFDSASASRRHRSCVSSDS